ncbi:MAG: hypothetical protein ABIO60_05800 [Aquaticitalea sp.]
MKVFKQVFDFYINSSLHVGLSAFSMAWITLLKFERPFDEWVLLFIFFATITGYNFVKYFGLAKFHHRSLSDWLKMIQVFSIICFGVMVFFALHLQAKSLMYIAGFGIITFLYAIPILPEHLFIDKQKNLRSIGGLKIYVIGLVWVGVTVLLPLLNNAYTFDTEVWLTAFQRFVFVVILMLPFEIRDLQYDSLRLSTIPQKIGIKNTKIIGIVLAIVFTLIEFFKTEIHPNEIVISMIIAVILILFLVYSKINQGKYYSSFWVESIPMLWLILHLVF